MSGQTDTGIMTPQILFQCNYCRLTLQVPIFYAGKTGPCPQCGNIIQTPVAFSPQGAAIETATAPTADHKRWADPTSNYAAETASLSRRTANETATPRSVHRGIFADNAIHHGDEMKKEDRRTIKMLLWFIAVMLLLAIATYVMKSFVIR